MADRSFWRAASSGAIWASTRLHLAVLFGVGGDQFGALAAQLGHLILKGTQRTIVEDIGKGFRRTGLGHLPSGLLGYAIPLSFGRLLLQLTQFVLGDVGLFRSGSFRSEHQAGTARVGLESVFGTLQLDAHVFQLARQPFAGVLAHLPAGFHVGVDEFLGQRVGEVGSEAGVGGVVQEFHDARLAGGADFQIAGGQAWSRDSSEELRLRQVEGLRQAATLAELGVRRPGCSSGR